MPLRISESSPIIKTHLRPANRSRRRLATMLIAAPRAPHAPALAAPRIVLDVDGLYLPLTERHRCADLVPDRQKDLRLELAHAAQAVVPRTNDGHGKDATERHRLPPHLERHDGGVAPEHHVDRDGLLGDIGVEREPRAALRRKLDVLQPAAVELLHVRAADLHSTRGRARREHGTRASLARAERREDTHTGMCVCRLSEARQEAEAAARE
mmetsp:Transcript_19155/g.57401  ORF Transcript_19155/g.57401 Transcript_19155/m.57401 type:complete len:211 (-) Transcript_19155:777-1409(-)